VPTSPELPLTTEQAIADLRALKPFYSGNVANSQQLRDKVMVAVQGPEAAGKSRATQTVIELDSEFSAIGTETTRRRYDHDPDGYVTANEGITHALFHAAAYNGEYVDFSILKNGHAYGTRPEGFPAEFNIGPITADSTDELMSAGFKRFYAVYILARGGLYQHRLETGRMHLPNVAARLEDDLESIELAEMNIDAPWMNFVESTNEVGGAYSAARKIIDIARQQPHEQFDPNLAAQYLKEMTTATKNVLRQVK